MKPADTAPVHEGLELVLAHIVQDFMRLMKRQGLSTPQIHALMYIHHAGECRVSDLGALTDTSAAAASQLVERLVQQGLVERREDPANRRTKLLTLSDKARKLIHSSVRSNPYLMNLISSLNVDQRETVQAAFALLAQAARQIQAAPGRKAEHHAQNA